jgi:hypothetical protein
LAEIFVLPVSLLHLDIGIEGSNRGKVSRIRYKGHTVNALAPGADEGRGKLRKAADRRKRPLTRRCPNGATCLEESRRP